MPCFFLEKDVLIKAFGLSEAKVLHAVFSAWVGTDRWLTLREFSDILSGKRKPQREVSEALDRVHVADEKVEAAREMERMVDNNWQPNDAGKVPATLLVAESLSLGFRKAGLEYFADTLGVIVESEKRAVAAHDLRHPQPEILKGGLAETVLNSEEIKALKSADDHQAIGLAIAPLRLKTPLYALAALEVDSLYQHEAAPSDFSVRVTGEGENAFVAFTNGLIKWTDKTAADFARKYMPDKKKEGSDEEAKIKKIHRWRKGENIPHWLDVLALGRALGEDDELPGDADCVQERTMFLFLLANYSSNATKCAKRLNMRLDVGSEYQRFLDIHLAEIKKRGQAK